MCTNQIDLGVIRCLTEGFREHGRPFQFQRIVGQEKVFAFQGRVDDVLAVPAHTHRPFLLVLAIAHFRLSHVHIAVIPGQLVLRIQAVIQLYVGTHAGLLCGIVTLLNAVVGRARLVIEVALLASIGVEEATCYHHA